MIVLSLVHVRNLHPGANLHPGCIFGHVNGVLRIRISNSRGGANLHRVQIVHMNAKCLISIHFDRTFRGRHFLLQFCIKPI